MIRRKSGQNAARIKATIKRVEGQEYPGKKPRRLPRLSSQSGVFFCVLSAQLDPPTGSWPTLTPGNLSTQTLYQSVNQELLALTDTFTVLNYDIGVTYAASKVTTLIPNGDGTFSVVTQVC